jgi:hypothetical protein
MNREEEEEEEERSCVAICAPRLPGGGVGHGAKDANERFSRQLDSQDGKMAYR